MKSIEPENRQVDVEEIEYSWRLKASEQYSAIVASIADFSSFQLLANIIHYNHSHSVEEYTDYREDRLFAVSEVVSLIALQSKFKPDSSIKPETLHLALKRVQDAAVTFLMLKRAVLSSVNSRVGNSTLTEVTNKLMADELIVRNPGLPEHHEMISAELFDPIDENLSTHFGFGIHDSITIRRQVIELFNFRFLKQLDSANERAASLVTEIVRFRNTGKTSIDTGLEMDQLRYFAALKSKQMKKEVKSYSICLIFHQLDDVYAFSDNDLATFCKLPISVVSAFLKHFSIGFQSVSQEDSIVKVDTVLKTKPIICANDLYIIPSFPLLTWCVEPAFEKYIKSSPKLSRRYKDIKHNYLLKKGIEYFKRMLPSGKFYPQNLFYGREKENLCEVDGLIGYDRTLFIIEAKGHRLSQKAKDGNYLRTETHLKQIIRDSTSQGVRAKRFIITSEGSAEFKTGTGEKVEILCSEYDEFIIVSLTLEPMGNLIPLMKVVNDLNYFEDGTFPWIISIYDLVVVADMIDVPILLLHYLKLRREFLSVQNIRIYEEIDILAYFLNSGLNIKHTLSQAEKSGVYQIIFENNTDAINDYYMYKFGKKTRFTKKPTYFLPTKFLQLLRAIDDSGIDHRTEIMLEMLECGKESIDKFLAFIRRTKNEFINDGRLHDCSILVGNNEVGVTYMIGPKKADLDKMLYKYCRYKFETQKTKTWVGVGDLSTSADSFDIQCSIIVKRETPIRYQ